MDKPIPEAVRAQAAAWFAEYDKHNHFPAMLAEDAYAAGYAAAQKQWQLDVGSPRTPEQIAATVAWVQSLADSDIAPQPTQPGQAVACGGCGNADPEKVCVGCLHNFAAPPSAPVGVDALLREYRPSMDVDVLHAWAKDVVAALAQQAAAVFRNDGNTEADFIAHEANACTACGGSGHKADQQPAVVDEAQLRYEDFYLREAAKLLHRRGLSDLASALTAALATQHKEPTT